MSPSKHPPTIPDPRQNARSSEAPAVVMRLHNYDVSEFAHVAAQFGSEKFAYVVTPNVDHLIRFHDDPSFRTLYASAGFILNDSRFLSRIVRVSKGLQLKVCAGSDLTEKLLAEVIKEDDQVLLIGATPAQAKALEQRYCLHSLQHFEPPMGFIRDQKAVEECLQFIESHSPFRFCFLALGSPQQEMLADQLRRRGIARGLTLCVGASINFLTGTERRAPLWIQKTGMEWAFRLLQDPARLAHRYLIRGPRIFKLLKHFQFESTNSATANAQGFQKLSS